ncbi:MAG TPA: hypothetical protein VFI24_25390 [Pyrinomonadaceae bacterium]|nr:hypothetical protein [Pyrinomonadaceae bacterium]
MTTIAQSTKPLPETPYRGIESFRFIDQRVFCAREEETWDLLSSILINRGVLLYGDSGSGKSSLINAGLIPAAIKENLYTHRLRVQPRRGREIKVERVPVEKDDGPPYLPSDLVDPGAPNDNSLSFEISIDEFFEQLDRLRGRRVNEPRPLLIFDQFEEFITLFEDASQGAEPSKDSPSTIQQKILNVLTSILQDEGLPVKLLFVFREEYLAKLNILFTSAPELLDQYVRLLPPRVGEAEQIILAPFVDDEVKEKFGGTSTRISDLQRLAKRIATQIQQRSENGFINLTELQIVCRKLWESRDPAKYFESNNADIQKVLEGYWADALKKLGDLYDPAIALLGHMITSTNTRNIVSEPDLKYFEKDNFSEAQISSALNALVESKLVRREPRHKIYFYEIVSEFLVPWIRDKKTARLAQIEAERLGAQTKERLKQVERERRYVSIGAVGLGVLVLLFGALGFWAYQRFKAEKAAREQLIAEQNRRAEAEKERDKTAALLQALLDLQSTDESKRLASINKFIELDREGKLPREFVPFVASVITYDRSDQVKKAGSYFVYQLQELNAIPTQTGEQKNISNLIVEAAEKNRVLLEARPPTIAPRIYFQLSSENQRPRADKIAAALRSLGFTVSAYDIVPRSPQTNQLRWYRPDNASDLESVNSNLEKALQKVREVDGSGWEPRPVTTSSSAQPNHFELWFAADHGSVSTPTPTPTPTATATPTPEPSKNVALNLTFVNEQGKEVTPRGLFARLQSTQSANEPAIAVTSNSVSAPPGIYLLTVRAPGYQPYSQKIILRGNELSYTVKLVRAQLIYPIK